MQIGTGRQLAERGLRVNAPDWSRVQNARLQRKYRVTRLICRPAKNPIVNRNSVAGPIHHLTICKEAPSFTTLSRFLDCESNAAKY